MTHHRTSARLLPAWLLTLLLALVPAAAVNAAEAAPEPVQDAPADEEPGAAPGSDEPGNGNADATAQTGEAETEPDQGPAVFVPTEEISEDFAVAFPVDI
jgi:hypothetical protein